MKKTLSIMLTLLLTFSLFISAIPVVASEPNVAIDSVTVQPATIVETLAANLKITVTGSELSGKAVYVYMDVAGAQLWKTDIPASGEVIMKIGAAPSKGTYQIVAKVEGTEISAITSIEVVEYKTDIWDFTLGLDESGYLTAAFDADIASISGGYTATVNNSECGALQTAQRILTLDVSTDFLMSGDIVKISGVKYPVLFPSFSFTFSKVFVKAEESDSVPMIARYSAPATNWETEAMAMGNGFIGAMIFGGVASDQVLINEHTLWSGGPGANTNYNGGFTTADYHTNLQNARRELQNRMTNFSNTSAAYINDSGRLITANYPNSISGTGAAPFSTYIAQLKGQKDNFGRYQQLGNIYITQPNASSYTNYERKLDVDNALSTATYTIDGVTYTKEYFVSNPGNIMAIRISADQPGKVTNGFSITTPQTRRTITVSDDTITMTGWPSDHNTQASNDPEFEKALHFAMQIKVIPTGGTMTASDSAIDVAGADSVLVVMSAGTNYQQCMDDTFDYFNGIDPLIGVKERVNAAAVKSFGELYKAHNDDYTAIYDRLELDIGGLEVPVKMTNVLQQNYIRTNTSAEDRYYETLYYQFCRYLMISCSRPGSLPANLQGIWANGLNPPWDADYHTNINLQMNYWPVHMANLSECHLPMIDYINSLVPRGTITAQKTAVTPAGGPVRGWTIYHENNIWGNTAPGNYDQGYYAPAAGAWCALDIWTYYQYTLDKEFLVANYDVLLNSALYWVDTLWTDERDGTLVSNPSYSPEHGQYSLGASSDQGTIWEIFEAVLNAGKALGKTNDPQLAEIKASQDKLWGPKIGLGGQFQEWKDEVSIDVSGDGAHRHTNHLFYLHPGTRIVVGRSAEEDAFAEAMKVTLNTRGDVSTGWSRGWKINFWARLRDGERSHKLVTELLRPQTNNGGGSTLPNLFDTHTPFQIDGNFGGLSGMTEMLLQSQGDSIDLLPTLPTAWKTGTVKGIKARGDIDVDMKWDNMELKNFVLKPGASQSVKIKGINIATGTLREGFNIVEFTTIDANTIICDVKADKVYTMTNIQPIPRSAECEITNVAEPFAIDGVNITGTVPNHTTAVNLNNILTISDKASWALYSDAERTMEVDKTVSPLVPGETVRYIRVTAENWNATKDYTITITRLTNTIGKFAIAPDMDGTMNLAQWGDKLFTLAEGAEGTNVMQINQRAGYPPEDFSTQIYMAYDANNLYLGMIVKDSLWIAARSGDGNLWQGCGFQLNLWSGSSGGRSEYGFGLTASGPAHWQWATASGGTNINTGYSNYSIKRVEDSDTFIYTIAIPLTSFRRNAATNPLTEGEELWFSICYNYPSTNSNISCAFDMGFHSKSLNDARSIILGSEIIPE